MNTLTKLFSSSAPQRAGWALVTLVAVGLALGVSCSSRQAPQRNLADKPATQPATRPAERSAVPGLAKARSDPSYAVRARAARALEAGVDPAILPALRELGAPSANLIAQGYVAQTIKNIGFGRYLAAIDSLLAGLPRPEAAAQFKAISQDFPDDIHTRTAGELAGQLERIGREDQAFHPPADLGKLTQKELIQYWTFRLRDVAVADPFVPGKCQVFLFTSGRKDDPAWALRRLGKPAIPALLALLEDRRPTRSASNAMNGSHVLRYADVALQTIEAIAARRFDTQTMRGAYLTNADEATRTAILKSVHDWWDANRNKSESQWIRESLAQTGIGRMWDTLGSAERLIEVEGPQATEFFRQRMAAEPDDGHIVRLLWKAGGAAVLGDIRPRMKSPRIYVRTAAYTALLEGGDAGVVDAATRDLNGLKRDDRDSIDAIIGSLAYSKALDGEVAAARLAGHEDTRIANEALRIAINAVWPWPTCRPSSQTVEAMLPHVVSAIADKRLDADVRYGAAHWVGLVKQLPMAWPDRPSARDREKAFSAIATWWAQRERSTQPATPPATQPADTQPAADPPTSASAKPGRQNREVYPPPGYTGLWTAWYAGGRKRCECAYIDGKPDGKWTYWYDSGLKTTEIDYAKGKIHGKHTIWHPNGKKASEGEYVDDRIRGSWTYWDEQGKLRDGAVVESYDNGRKKSEEHYRQGKREGTFAYWDQQGRKHREEEYRSGKLHGASKTWYPNGQMQSLFEWKDGKKHGKQASWYPNGWKEDEREFEEGRCVRVVPLTGTLSPKQWAVQRAKEDIAGGKKRILYIGKPWSVGKPLIDEASGLPVEIIAGCTETGELDEKVDAYNEAMRASARKSDKPAAPATRRGEDAR
jgi:antitoxin component YwqK of YwqJK toxin-antitoxin module